MLTKECKIVLNNLKTLTLNTEADICYLGETTYFCLVSDHSKFYDYGSFYREIGSILDPLANEGYIVYTINPYHFKLTQKSLHSGQFIFSTFLSYAADKAIDFIALIISIIALLKSYGYDVLTPLFTLCKSLLEQLSK